MVAGDCVAKGGMCGEGGACVVKGGHVWQRKACVAKGGMHGKRGGMRGIRRDTVNEWAGRILLECILVSKSF